MTPHANVAANIDQPINGMNKDAPDRVGRKTIGSVLNRLNNQQKRRGGRFENHATASSSSQIASAISLPIGPLILKISLRKRPLWSKKVSSVKTRRKSST